MMKAIRHFYRPQGLGPELSILSLIFASFLGFLYGRDTLNDNCVFQKGDQIQLADGTPAYVHRAFSLDWFYTDVDDTDPWNCEYDVSWFDTLNQKQEEFVYPTQYKKKKGNDL